MARKKKGSGKPRKKSAGGKAGARTKRAPGSKAKRAGAATGQFLLVEGYAG